MEYNAIFKDIVKILKKSIFHLGYIPPEFPITFDDTLNKNEIPNYLIVNELKEIIK